MRFETGSPQTRSDLADALELLRGDITKAFSELDMAVFLAPQGDHWSPADHLRHLILSVRPLARAMGYPKVVLACRFGISRRQGLSFDVLKERYEKALAAGAQAGSFTPSPRKDGVSDEAWRAQIFEHWEQEGQFLEAELCHWGETTLNRLRLPHPVLGKLTVREMLFFTVNHNRHHASRVFERLN